MNTILILSVLLVASQLTLASKKPDISALLFFSQQTSNNCRNPGLQCKDCQTIQYCSSSNLESLFEIHCEDQSRLRPYCDIETNTCVKDKPTVCDIPETSFHCPGTGYYPDLEDCANYYTCDENKVATKMACPAGYNWVQGNQTCTPVFYCRSYSPKLGQCKGKTNKLVAYAPDKNMYVLCLSNGPILFQCPNKWDVFDEAEVTCKFECTQNGYFPNPSDPTKFYACAKNGKGFDVTLLECPEGYEFVDLGLGQGICTYRTTTTTTTTTTEATTILDLTTIVETEQNEEIPAENNNEEHHSQELEQNNSENNNEEEHHSEDLDEENDDVNHSEANNEEEHNSEEMGEHIDEANNSENNNEEHNSEDVQHENIEDEQHVEENHEVEPVDTFEENQDETRNESNQNENEELDEE